jgi:hypothetical protein
MSNHLRLRRRARRSRHRAEAAANRLLGEWLKSPAGRPFATKWSDATGAMSKLSTEDYDLLPGEAEAHANERHAAKPPLVRAR